MAAGELGTNGKDGHMVWKVTTVMEEVGKGGRKLEKVLVYRKIVDPWNSLRRRK